MSQCRNSLCSAHTDSVLTWALGSSQGCEQMKWLVPMKHHTSDTGEPFSPLVFKPPFKSLLLFNEMLHNKRDWRRQLANHPVMKAKDVNCLPALLHQTPTWQERIPRGVASSLWISMLLSKKNLLWWAPRAHLVLPGVWGRTKLRSNRTGENKPTPDQHIPLILLKLRWIFDLPRCRSFLHIEGLIYQGPE